MAHAKKHHEEKHHEKKDHKKMEKPMPKHGKMADSEKEGHKNKKK